MTQIAALLRPRPRDAEVTKSTKSRVFYMTLVDWYKVGRDEPANVNLYKHGVTRDTIKVKVSAA